MADVGMNPARIIPAWTDFVRRSRGRRLRGIGEPIWAERSAGRARGMRTARGPANVAFAGQRRFHPAVPLRHRGARRGAWSTTARRNHPYVIRTGSPTASDDYLGTEQLAGPSHGPSSRAAVHRPSNCVFRSGILGGTAVARAAGGHERRPRARPGRRCRGRGERGGLEHPAPRRRSGRAADLVGARHLDLRGD